MQRSRAMRLPRAVVSPISESSDDGAFRAGRAAAVSVHLPRTSERRPRLYTSHVKVDWNRPAHFRRALPIRTLSGHRQLRGLSEECLLSETDSIAAHKKPSTNYQSFEEYHLNMTKETANTDAALRNGAKKSVGNQSKKSIIMGPPCDDVLEELNMMETNLRR